MAATLLFGAVFGYLAATFDYPDVLNRPAAVVLPRLLALGPTGRAVWLLYAAIPLLLILAARGVSEATRTVAPRSSRLAWWFAVTSAAAMTIGLLRWPTLHWALATEWMQAPQDARAVLATRFDTSNLYLGRVVGEFVGELFLNAFFLTASVALARTQPSRRWLLLVGVPASTLGWIAMLRNMTPLVTQVAAINNGVLPLWMFTLGAALATAGASSARSAAKHAAPVSQV